MASLTTSRWEVIARARGMIPGPFLADPLDPARLDSSQAAAVRDSSACRPWQAAGWSGPSVVASSRPDSDWSFDRSLSANAPPPDQQLPDR